MWVIALALAMGPLAGLGGVAERLTGRQAAAEPLRYAAHVAAAEALGVIGQQEAAGWQWRRAFAHTGDREGRVAVLQAWRRLIAPVRRPEATLPGEPRLSRLGRMYHLRPPASSCFLWSRFSTTVEGPPRGIFRQAPVPASLCARDEMHASAFVR